MKILKRTTALLLTIALITPLLPGPGLSLAFTAQANIFRDIIDTVTNRQPGPTDPSDLAELNRQARINAETPVTAPGASWNRDITFSYGDIVALGEVAYIDTANSLRLQEISHIDNLYGRVKETGPGNRAVLTAQPHNTRVGRETYAFHPVFRGNVLSQIVEPFPGDINTMFKPDLPAGDFSPVNLARVSDPAVGTVLELPDDMIMGGISHDYVDPDQRTHVDVVIIENQPIPEDILDYFINTINDPNSEILAEREIPGVIVNPDQERGSLFANRASPYAIRINYEEFRHITWSQKDSLLRAVGRVFDDYTERFNRHIFLFQRANRDLVIREIRFDALGLRIAYFESLRDNTRLMADPLLASHVNSQLRALNASRVS